MAIPKNQIRSQNTITQSTFEDSADALRTLLVDGVGQPISPTNGLPVFVVEASANSSVVKSQFAEISSVATGATVTILTHVVTATSHDLLLKVEVSGTNIATYDVLLNGQNYARTRTYFGDSLNGTIEFGSSLASAPSLAIGDVLTIKVTNFRPSAGDFEARLQYIEV